MKGYSYRRKPGRNNLTTPKNMLKRQGVLREVHPPAEGIPEDKPARTGRREEKTK